MIKKILPWLAVIFMSLQIFGFSSKTATESSGTSEKIANSIVKIVENVFEIDEPKREEVFHTVHFAIRKCAHFAEFFVLSLLTFLLARSYGLKVGLCVIINLGYCLLFAATDEIHQLFVSGRSGELRDVAIDFCGGIFANLCTLSVINLKKRFFDKK